MCGRFGFAKYDDEFYPRFRISNRLEGMPVQQNIAPGQYVPVVYDKDGVIIENMKWGLVPQWAKDPKIGYKMINARVETVLEKVSFRNAVKSRRCLIPATNFYEWKKVDGSKIPHHIGLKERRYFAMAGIFEIWKDVEGKEFKTFAIITKPAESGMEDLHDRMPLILNEEHESLWLSKNDDVAAILNEIVQRNTAELEIFEVSKDLKPII